ncbi:MAG: hypothetical protein EP329_23455 [Deltaproteobacteria bacterium]|nr:MAG: hypothetical protein EP329_23455 [Deltaproteobacteria bacterium]
MRRSPRVGAETRRALAAFTKPHRQLRYAGGEVLARGRVHGAEVVVDPDALRFPVRGFDAFDWPPTPSRVEYDTWKALALLGKRGLARVDALLADVVAASPGADAVIRDGHLVIRFSGAITPVDVERAAERAARRVADLDRLGLVGKDPVALAADAVTGRDMPDELRRALFDGLATFHRHDEATRAAAARLLDHRDARLARAAAELLADEEAAARIDARAGGLALATTEDGRLSVAEDAEEMSAPARSE